MNISIRPEKRESRDERAHRIASEIILKERLKRERKTENLRAKRLEMESSSQAD